MNVQPMHLFYICGITYYAIGFVVSFCMGISQRKSNGGDCNSYCVFNVLRVYLIPIITCFDFFSDVTIAILWLSDSHTRNKGFVSVSILLAQRIISAFILGYGHSWWIGVRQFFDLEVFNFILLSVKYDRQVYGLKKYKILEGLLESFPQLLMQMYSLVKEEHDDDSKLPLEHISIITSLLSLTLCFLFIDVTAIVPNRFTYVKLGCIGIWRFGDLVMRTSVMVTFANASLVSAKIGTPLMFVVQLVFNMILMRYFSDSKKATIFYINRLESNLSLENFQIYSGTHQERQKDHKPSFQRAFNSSFVSRGFNSSFVSLSAMISNKEAENMDRELGRIIDKRIPKKQHHVYIMIRDVSSWIISELGTAFFAILALPSLVPRRFVVFFYLFKFSFEGSLIAACVYNAGGFGSINNAKDFLHFLSDEIFPDIWWYWLLGVLCFVIGGILSFFSINTKQWSDAMEGTGEVILGLMKTKHYSFVERIVDNGVCTVKKIIKLAIEELDDDPKPTVSINLEKKPYCELLFLMLRERIILLGPNKKIRREAVSNRKYRNYVVSALLSECNESRQMTKEIMLAKLIFHKLVQDEPSAEKYWYVKIRNAGASLTFLRFHLGADIKYFVKDNYFNCEAKELMAEHFDLLFCMQCGFSTKELVECGFESDLVNDRVFHNPSCVKLEMLKNFKHKLFAMNFSVKQLKDSNLFRDCDILNWFRDYCDEINGFTPRQQTAYHISDYSTHTTGYRCFEFMKSMQGIVHVNTSTTVSMMNLHSSSTLNLNTSSIIHLHSPKKIISEFSYENEGSESSSIWMKKSSKSLPRRNIIPLSSITTLKPVKFYSGSL